MSEWNTAGDYPAYRAPSESERALITPASTGTTLDQLVERLRAAEPEHVTAPELPQLCGNRLDAVRMQARCEAVQLAVRFTSRYRDVGDLRFCRRKTDLTQNHSGGIPVASELTRATKPLVLTGHQPELFHAGVWFKNFLAAQLAERVGGLAINFLVDNDVCRSTAIRVPTQLEQGGMIAHSIPFDEQGSAIPWELRQLHSRDTWNSFPQRVSESLRSLAGSPLVEELWPLATEGLEATDRLGLALSQGRHQLERQLGLKSLEVPLSWLAGTEAFARFSLSILQALPEFQAVYNGQLDRYRRAHQIRNHAHPVPALERQHDWLEAPLWVYRKSAPSRQRLWISRRGGQWCLSDRVGWQTCLDGSLDGDGAVQQWCDLRREGVCLRPRALLTTMYTRLFVSDLFVHGIGGGKYDQLTDAIIAEFFRLPPPPMIVASATLHLPLDTQLTRNGSRAETQQQIQHYRDRMWRAKFHGDELVADTIARDPEVAAEVARLQDRKQELLASIPPRGQKWDWHHEMTSVNKRLAELAEPQASEAKQAVDSLTAIERQQRLLESREFSFALFPRDYIATVLNRLAIA